MLQTKQAIARFSIQKVGVDFIIAFLGSVFLAILSQLSIPLPFTPVPLTLQTFGIFILGGILGSRLAVYSVLAYLVQGTCGLPVLAGGIANPLWFLDPKAGFLVSFVVAAYLIGKLLENRKEASLFIFLLSLVIGQLAISLIGMFWLAIYVGLSKAFLFGVLPFLSAAAIKITAGALSLKGYGMCVRTLYAPKKG